MDDEKKVFSFSSAELDEAEELNARTDTRMTEEYKEFLRQQYGDEDTFDPENAPESTDGGPIIDTDSEEFLAETDFTFDYEDECPSHGTDYDHSDDFLTTETYIDPSEDYVELETDYSAANDFTPDEEDFESEEDYFEEDPDLE